MPLPPVASFSGTPFVLVAWDWVAFSVSTGNPEHHSGLLKPNEAKIGTVARADICSITLETEFPPVNMAVWGYDELGPDGGAADAHTPIAGFASIDGDQESSFDVAVHDSNTTVSFSDLSFPSTVRLLIFQVGWRLEEPVADAPLIGASWATYVE